MICLGKNKATRLRIAYLPIVEMGEVTKCKAKTTENPSHKDLLPVLQDIYTLCETKCSAKVPILVPKLLSKLHSTNCACLPHRRGDRGCAVICLLCVYPAE